MRGRVDGGVHMYLWHPVNAIEAEGYCRLVPDRQISMQANNLDSKWFARSHERHYREAPIPKYSKFRGVAVEIT